MEMSKKKSAGYERLVNFLCSRGLRNCVLLALIAISTFFMFLMDEGNWVRALYLGALEDNFFADLLTLLGVGAFNITMGSWIIFGCIVLFCTLMLLGNIFAPKIIGVRIEQKKDDFKSKHSATVFYATIYYLCIFLFCAALVFVFYMAGFFNEMGAKDVNIFLNLLYTVLLCLIFCLLLLAAIALVYYAIKFVLYIIALLVAGVKNLSRDITTTARIKIEELDENLSPLEVNGTVEGIGGGDGSGCTVIYKGLFPTLMQIDDENSNKEEITVEPAQESVVDAEAPVQEDVVDEENMLSPLEDFVLRFQSFAANKHQIYYQLPLLRAFFAGLATSRLTILEGLSGTGKSMLPRMFTEFIGTSAFFAPVQATWRDKTDILGFYSEFSRNFKATDFLERLYGASYSDKPNIMVLDEMNLSRIEYYFADFLSVLE